MRRVLVEEWYECRCEGSVLQKKTFWCLKLPAGSRYCECLSPQLPYTYKIFFFSFFFLIRRMQTSACGGQTGYMQQVKAHQRYTLFIKHSARTKAKTERAERFSAPREELLSDFQKKKKSGCRVLRNRWYCDVQRLWFFWDLHHSDPSRTGEHQDFIEIESEEDEG